MIVGLSTGYIENWHIAHVKIHLRSINKSHIAYEWLELPQLLEEPNDHHKKSKSHWRKGNGSNSDLAQFYQGLLVFIWEFLKDLYQAFTINIQSKQDEYDVFIKQGVCIKWGVCIKKRIELSMILWISISAISQLQVCIWYDFSKDQLTNY